MQKRDCILDIDSCFSGHFSEVGGASRSSTYTQSMFMFPTGSDDSWATPETTYTYFRNITLWGGSSPSNFTGAEVNAVPRIGTTFGLLSTLLVLFLCI